MIARHTAVLIHPRRPGSVPSSIDSERSVALYISLSAPRPWTPSLRLASAPPRGFLSPLLSFLLSRPRRLVAPFQAAPRSPPLPRLGTQNGAYAPSPTPEHCSRTRPRPHTRLPYGLYDPRFP